MNLEIDILIEFLKRIFNIVFVRAWWKMALVYKFSVRNWNIVSEYIFFNFQN